MSPDADKAFFTDRIGTLSLLRCAALPCRHGFSTRTGGVSTAPHLASLNLGADRGDEADAVKENRRRFAAAVGYDPDRAVSAHQIHSACVTTVDEKDAGRSDFSCDGFVTRTRDLPLLVKVADCVPVLLCDSTNGVIGALHAGWRGTVADIAASGVAAMCALGADPKTITAAVGPCIGVCCYEIGEEVAEAIRAVAGDSAARFLRQTGAGKYHADLPALNAYLLGRAGVAQERIALCGRCTCCESDLFFSHRASHGMRGVMAAAILL